MANKRGLRALTVASLISLVCIFFAFWSWMPFWKYLDRFPGLICILPFWLPYRFVLLRLYGGRFKSALALAIAMGCALFVPGALLLRFVIEWKTGWWVPLALALLMQPVLVAAAIWTYRSPGEPFKPWGSTTYGIVLFGLFWLVYAPIPSQSIDNETEAEDRLREITLLGYENKFIYPKAECDFDHLLDLLHRNPERGYNFAYRTVDSETSVRGCRVDTSFIITARPVAYRKTDIRSFLVDQSKQDHKWLHANSIRIHFTSEDRPATTSDADEDIELYTHRGFD